MQAVTPGDIKITFSASDTPGQIETDIATAINSADQTAGEHRVVRREHHRQPRAPRLSPSCRQRRTSAGVTISPGRHQHAANVPRSLALNGETFTITQGTTSVTFQFVDTSNAANQAAAGDTAIDFNSTTDTIATVRAAMVAAINSAFNGSLNATGLEAAAVPYIGSGGDTAGAVPGTVALANFTPTQTFTFTPRGSHDRPDRGRHSRGDRGQPTRRLRRVAVSRPGCAGNPSGDRSRAQLFPTPRGQLRSRSQGSLVTINDPNASHYAA